jgi:F0F1-type ATP synthase gamma subunit
LLKEVKDMMLQQNEAVVRQQIVRADTETAQIERSMQQLASSRGGELSSVPQQTSESEQSRQELLQELTRQQAANNAFKAMCEEALSTTIYERTAQKIKGVKATNNSSAITGFINTSGEEERIEQDISDIGADNWSIAVAGVIKNVDFKDLRPGGADGGDRDDVRRKL